MDKLTKDIRANMTQQEIVDFCFDHLIEQGRPSMLGDEDGTCAYRGEGGTSCAVGCFIFDDEYSGRFEGDAVKSLLSKHVKNSPLKTWLHKNLKLLKRLQEFHDFEFSLKSICELEVDFPELNFEDIKQKWKEKFDA